jgi:predicted GIY-YIG superfamily endonuclease
MRICEQKNSSDLQCPSLESVAVERLKLEPPSRHAKQLTQGGRRFSVYALTEDGRMRYIGITSQPLKRRLYQHLQDVSRPNRTEHKTNWLLACRRDGKTVSIKAIRRGLDESSAQRIEVQIIKRLGDRLVNVHEGGSSGYGGLNEDARIRHSISCKARYYDESERKVALTMAKVRAAKERKRLSRGQSELDEELRWLRGEEITKTNP